MPLESPLAACPECGSRDLLVEDHEEGALFRCLRCARLWRVQLGYVWEVSMWDAEVTSAGTEEDPPELAGRPQ